MATSTVELTEIEAPQRAQLAASAPSAEAALLQTSVVQTESTAATNNAPQLSSSKAVIIIGAVAGVTFLNVTASGMLTVALPTIAKDLDLPHSLLLWPASIYALSCGCTLLLSGAFADVLGRRPIYLAGCLLFSIFMLGCGLARTSYELILFRGLQGVAISLCFTTAVGIITTTFPEGGRRNAAFASLGAGQPVGYSVGLVLGGVFVDGIGWRWGYYVAAAASLAVFLAAWWGIPKDEEEQEHSRRWNRLWQEVDWVGTFIASVSLGMLISVLAMITGNTASIHDPPAIALISVGSALIPAFIYWVYRQEKLGRPAVVPNSIWKQSAFTSSCIAVFCTWASFNAFGYFSTLFLQEIQKLSALQTSLRFLPTVVCGVAANIVTGYLVGKVSANTLVIISTAITSIAPALMAVADPAWPYWYAVFPAMFLSPMSSDVLYTTSNLIISSAFPRSNQSLAGGVFNTVAQIGNSVGLAIAAVIASSVTGTNDSSAPDTDSVLKGYRATFWTSFAAIFIVIFISWAGLRSVGKVGLKRE